MPSSLSEAVNPSISVSNLSPSVIVIFLPFKTGASSSITFTVNVFEAFAPFLSDTVAVTL